MRNIRTIVILLAVAFTALAQCPSAIHVASGNFSDDIVGQQDNRPGTWGTAGVAWHEIKFAPPAGCAVKVLSISGDLQAWVRGWSYGKAGALVGLDRKLWNGQNPWGSCTYCSEATPFYRQVAVNGQDPQTTTFDRHYKDGFLVGPDNRLGVKQAVYLNDTGQPVHVEFTWTMEFRWVEEPEAK